MLRNHVRSVPLLLAVIAFLIVATQGVAVEAQTEERKGYFGEVTSVTADVVQLELRSGDLIDIRVDPSGEGRVAAGLEEGQTLPDILTVGVRVAVLAELRGEEWFAVKLSPIRSKSEDRHLTVTVVSVSGTTVIAESAAGDEIIIELDFEPPGDLTSQVVTFIGRAIGTNHFKARDATGIQEVVERLGNHVRQKTQEADREGESRAKQNKRRQLAELKARLESAVGAQLDRFVEVLVKSPDDARATLEAALEEIKGRFTSALESLEKPLEEVDQMLERRDIVGTVESIDIETGLATVRSQTGAVLTVAVGPNVGVAIGDAQGDLNDLQEGDHARVKFDASGEAARVVVRVEGQAEGRVESIDLEARTVTLAFRGGAQLTLTLPEGQVVEIGDRAVSLNDLELGTVVKVTYDSRARRILRIRGELRADLDLTVEEVDPEAGTITALTDDGRRLTIRASDRGHVDIDGQRSGIAALSPGARIEVVVDTSTGEAVNIELDRDELRRRARTRGVPVGVNVEDGTLTLKLADGSHLTLLVDDATRLRLDKAVATLADIRSDTAAEVVYDSNSRIALDIEAHTSVQPTRVVRVRTEDSETAAQDAEPVGDVTVDGVIAGLDLLGGSITIYTEGRRVRPLKVLSRTVITLNGEDLDTFIDLPLGSNVVVTFSKGNEALEISATRREDAIEDILKRADSPDVRERLAQARGGLSLEVRGVAVAGGRIAFQVTSNQHPVEGAEISVNDRVLGTTDDRGLLGFVVPADATGLGVTASLRGQSTGLKLRVASRSEDEERHTLAQRVKIEAEEVAGRLKEELERQAERFKAEIRDPDEETQDCIQRVLGRVPTGEDDVTESDKRRAAEKCFGGHQLDTGPKEEFDSATQQCIDRALARLSADRDDLTEEQKRLISRECIGKTEPEPDDKVSQCVQKVLGRAPANRDDLTDSEKRRINRECLNTREEEPDDTANQCVRKVLGREQSADDLTNEEKRKINQECFGAQHPTGDSPDNGRPGTRDPNAERPTPGELRDRDDNTVPSNGETHSDEETKTDLTGSGEHDAGETAPEPTDGGAHVGEEAPPLDEGGSGTAPPPDNSGGEPPPPEHTGDEPPPPPSGEGGGGP